MKVACICLWNGVHDDHRCQICSELAVQGFKSHYFRAVFGMWSEAEKSAHKDLPAAARSLNFRSPLDILFWYSVANNVCSIFGLAGVLAAQRVSVLLNMACIMCQFCKPYEGADWHDFEVV